MGAHTGMGKIKQMMFPLAFKMMVPLGLMHKVEVGAKRYVDAVNREGGFADFQSGTFLASAHGVSGRVSDQAMRKEKRATQYGDIHKQGAAFAAVQSFAVTA